MFKKIGVIAVVMVIAASLLVGLAPGLSLAAGNIAVVSSFATPQFPSSLAFNVQATSGANIVDVRLHYSVERDSFVNIVTEEKPAITPSNSVTAAYNWDMRQSGGLPTGTVVDFWWTIMDCTEGQLRRHALQLAQHQRGQYHNLLVQRQCFSVADADGHGSNRPGQP
jgi:hypothetical protein